MCKLFSAAFGTYGLKKITAHYYYYYCHELITKKRKNIWSSSLPFLYNYYSFGYTSNCVCRVQIWFTTELCFIMINQQYWGRNPNIKTGLITEQGIHAFQLSHHPWKNMILQYCLWEKDNFSAKDDRMWSLLGSCSIGKAVPMWDSLSIFLGILNFIWFN